MNDTRAHNATTVSTWQQLDYAEADSAGPRIKTREGVLICSMFSDSYESWEFPIRSLALR
jgi:hypothetical protein